MNQNKLSIRFVINKARVNKKGKCPLHCRMTYGQNRKQFATGQFMQYSEWDSKRQVTKHQLVNTQLELVKSKIQSSYLKLQLQGEVFNIDNIYGLYLGKEVDSVAEASKKSGLSKTPISRVCRSERKKARGYVWKYIQ
ncbi:Arm DNA-binding domain-containing protein [Flagellimonas pacifica]|uniref:Phage integrase SAM-like domain-containing protein n=1 Tax=Flagellimonas pacifica TaxID=1247520 RepID=A0A285MEY7_9FLAO|nr:Arm DNA-binding domain-containing protein [Allomuricauda parva]SNY95283.1 Phage integrase SAM-like domain-containing protein [Allomuricauda parva]